MFHKSVLSGNKLNLENLSMARHNSVSPCTKYLFTRSTGVNLSS